MNPFPNPSKFRACLNRLFENGLFWMALVLLSIGAVTTFYYQSSVVSGSGLPHIFAGRESASSPDPSQPMSRALTAHPWVSLTFDVTGTGQQAREITDILKSNRVQAAFFISETWADAYPDDVSYIASQGYEIGGRSEHTQSAGEPSEHDPLQNMQSLAKQLSRLSGHPMNFYRLPLQNFSPSEAEAAAGLNCTSISWSVDSMDWKDYGSVSISDTVLNHPKLQNGSIILLHTGAKYTPEALKTLIPGLQAKGYDIVPLSELLN